MEARSVPEREPGGVEAAGAKPPKPSSAEGVKAASRRLRGSIAETLRSDAADFGKEDEVLLKFHGVYQQEDRERRTEERRAGGQTGVQFMVRVAIPAG